jgi:hypothetical protein
MTRRGALALTLLLGCGEERHLPVLTGFEDLAAQSVAPATWLPGTTVVVSGRDFAGAPLASAHLRIRGRVAARAVDTVLAARVQDGGRIQATVPPDLVGSGGQLSGELTVLISAASGNTYAAPGLPLGVTLASELVPTLEHALAEPLFVNDPVIVGGDGVLLGAGEGETHLVLGGCFLPAGGGACAPTGEIEVPARAADSDPFSRRVAAAVYATSVSGIGPGTFTGTARLRNVMASGVRRDSSALPVTWHIGKPLVTAVTPPAASLGQFVLFQGGGFVGGAPDELTLLRLQGTFTPDSGPALGAVSVSAQLVPEFAGGQLARYVLDQADGALGVDLRASSGRLVGTVTPIVRKGANTVTGDPSPVGLAIAPVKQVIWIRFQDSYVDSLRRLGLRAVDLAIRDRIFDVCRRDYQGVNVEFRTEEPSDFALYSIVDVDGPDPNDQGLLGYDNTPGKDVGNQRLFDRIGGLNARTQEDGFPGFGGVFAEEFLGFSEHPAGVAQLPLHTPVFDRIFDEFRPDVGGREVTAADLPAGGPARLVDGARCPAQARADRLGCAVFVLGNLIGTTLTHEIGHSLGLANPYGDGYHDAGDLPNRLMDAGSGRPFEERAELSGQGPAVFCDDEYDYLRNTILRGAVTPPPAVTRPVCN